ncbi:hypothetical protein D3C72_2376390 [compost metagenome]
MIRVPDPLDGRAYTLQISELGSDTLKKDMDIRQDKIGQLLEDWSEEEREYFGQLLQKLNEAIFRIM